MSSSDENDSFLSKSVEEQLLCTARSGDVQKMQELLEDAARNEINLNIKGQHKSNCGWTSLHLAAYFGHLDAVKLLLKHGANVNLINNTGDTPLHKAAFTGREEIVLLLISNSADVFVRNGEGQTARDVSKTEEIKKLLKGAEQTDLRKKNDLLLHAAREGDIKVIKELLQGIHPPDINYVDSLGNTALHCASYRGNKETALLLLQNGINPAIRNNRGQLATDLAVNEQMKQILGIQPVKQLQKTALRFEGPLLRKSRFIGWKEAWIILDKGVMSSFTSRADATTGTHRKAYKYLDGAEVLLDDTDAYAFIIKYSNNRRQKYCVPFAAQQQVDRQKWVNAVNQHIEFSSHYLKQGLSESDDDTLDGAMPLGTLQEKLQTAQAHQQLLEKQAKHVKELCEASIKHIPNSRGPGSAEFHDQPWNDLSIQLNKLVDMTRTASASLSHCLSVFAQQEELRQLQFKQQQEQIRVWQDALHALAQEHHELEKSLVTSFHSPPGSPVYPDTDCDEFFDAYEGDCSPPERSTLHSTLQRVASIQSVESETVFFASFASFSSSITEPLKDLPRSKWGRALLPVPQFSRNDFSVWSILRQCIGRELSKITMPVVFNEPLSLLQRVAENIEYFDLLNKASDCDDPLKRLEYVSAFAVSSISSNWERLGKPFNPLLGETYELVREDFGLRILTEQVSHHPPVTAFHADSPNFLFNGAIRPKLSFNLVSRSVDVRPEGTTTLRLLKHNEVYTWTGIYCCVHNIIVGKLWMEQCGNLEIKCHSTGLWTSLTFKPAGWFGRDLNRVEGFIYDRTMNKLRFLYGRWCSYLRSTDVDCYEDYMLVKESSYNSKSASGSMHNLEENININDAQEANDTSNLNRYSPVCEAVPSELLWEADPRPRLSPEYFHFTSFAMALNETNADLEKLLPPTDSRLRPDIRKLEEGDIDGAAYEKNRLEEKQRAARNRRKKEHGDWVPKWFKSQRHQYAQEDTWVYKGGYWDRNFVDCPDIF